MYGIRLSKRTTEIIERYMKEIERAYPGEDGKFYAETYRDCFYAGFEDGVTSVIINSAKDIKDDEAFIKYMTDKYGFADNSVKMLLEIGRR